ncbi:hypothetical protein AWL63_24245 (plasmid) [Sphingomonas panacis]|uniref:Microcin J25-processing protein McjB C-terminal domain-containing protein n=2 Tax=Sphingomonas panacis TaxID=1560345 RepID=A0A1B3ZIL3_9SPHN|nr:hypothetical protein AWL63_24245 [Sphingomonas panacis]
MGDRYFTLSGGRAESFVKLSRGQEIPAADIDFLQSQGIIQPSNGSMEIAPQLAPSLACSWSEPLGRPGAFRILRAIFELFAARIELRRVGLAAVLERLSRARRRSDSLVRPEAISSVIASFATVDLLFTPQGQCLVRSIAMARTLARAGCDFNLVIGVRSGPFGAHCWIQQRSVILNDQLDRVRDFVPIFVL